MKAKAIQGDNKQYKVLTALSSIIFLVWVLSGIITYYATIRGYVWCGNFTFFFGLAFAALIYTTIMQREEIKMNREEIVLNRKELKKATTAQVHSQEALKEQVKQTHLTAK